MKLEQYYKIFKILILVFFLIWYIFFTNSFIQFSQKILSPVYKISKPYMDIDNVIEVISVSNEEIIKSEKELLYPLQVIAKPPQVSYDTIILSKDKDFLISEGEYLFEKEGNLVGYINRSISKENVSAILFSAPNLINIVSVNGYVTESIGLGGGGFKIIVPKDLEVEKGEKIIHQDTNSFIGEAVNIVENEDEITKSIFSNIFTNIFKIDKLYVKRINND